MSRRYPFGSDEERATRIEHVPAFQSRFSKTMLMLGGAVMAYGVYGLFADANRTHPGVWIRWFAGALVAHDFLVAPVVFGAGMLVARLVPARIRGPVQGALAASAIVTLAAWPNLRGYGRRADNPTALPNNYARGLLLAYAIIWLLAGVILVMSRRRPRRRRVFWT